MNFLRRCQRRSMGCAKRMPNTRKDSRLAADRGVQRGGRAPTRIACGPCGARRESSHPVMRYIDGGGWVVGRPRTHRKIAMEFAKQGCLMFNLEYRLAPENPFPAGFDDCVFAAHWIAENAKRWSGNSRQMFIGSDSAGGNLSAATLLALGRKSDGPRFNAGVQKGDGRGDETRGHRARATYLRTNAARVSADGRAIFRQGSIQANIRFSEKVLIAGKINLLANSARSPY
jgi:acetyl esterase/lipase